MLSICVRGQKINVPAYVVEQVPFFQALRETKPENDDVSVEMLSPEIVKHVIASVQNQWTTRKFREVCKDIEPKAIEDALRYLHLPDILDKYCFERDFGDQVAIDDTLVYEPDFKSGKKRRIRLYRMANGRYKRKYCELWYRKVDARQLVVDNEVRLLVEHNNTKCLLPEAAVRKVDGAFYMTNEQLRDFDSN